MATVTIISDEARTVDGAAAGDRMTLDAERLPDAVGWQLKPEGLCQADVCVPVRDRDALFVDGRLDVAAVAGALGRAAVVDAAAGIAAIANDAETRRQALDGLQAPDFTLNDLDGNPHRLSEWHGKKRLLAAFASW
ncbi:MAG: hypothetical protein JWO37_3666 [Acidimicrobiales bacterium]|jgi:hypothetical protein|nr:hypothetical protein [Acidimicrobiales bacterium]